MMAGSSNHPSSLMRTRLWGTPSHATASVAANRIDSDRRTVLMERIECQWCHEQNAPDRTHCESCGAPLDVKDSVGEPVSNAAPMPPPPQWSYPPAPSYPYPAAPPPGWASGYRPWRWLWVLMIFPVLII